MPRPTRLQRAALRLAFALLVVAASFWATSPHQEASAQRHPAPRFLYAGADAARTWNAIAHIWPQSSGAYCGIATAMAMVNYEDQLHRVRMRFRSRADQQAIAAANQTAGASQWGSATPINQFAGVTNIAPDFGTDPRSIAYIASTYAPGRVRFHDYIYRWEFANAAEPPFVTQAQQATTSLARALRTWHEPISVTINAGQHSVLVTGVYTVGDPTRSYPAQISSVVYRDPMASPSVSRFRVSFYTWTHGHYFTPSGVYSLWSAYYSSKLDPEPTVGPYAPTAEHPSHWYHGFTWIQRDGNAATSPDFAYTAAGSLMTTP